MLSIFKSFKASVPNLGALRLAIVILICLPVIWVQDEAGYELWKEQRAELYKHELNYYKFSIAGGNKASCVMSLSDIDNETAYMIGQKSGVIEGTSKLIGKGREKIGLQSEEACEGVPDNRVFLLPYLSTQLEHRADYAMISLSHWIARFIYLYLMFMAISNVFNRHYARPENMLLQQQMMRYMEHKKPKKNIKKKGFFNKKTLSDLKNDLNNKKR